MKNKHTYWLLIFLTGIVVFSCSKRLVGKGEVVAQNRLVENFEGVVLKVPGKLVYTPAADYKVQLQSHQNILDEVVTEVNDGNLVIRFKEHNTNLRSRDEIIIYITSPQVSRLEIHGSGTIETTDVIDPFSLRLLISGSGKITVNELTTGSLAAKIEGSGKIALRGGAVASEFLEITGSGEMDMVNVNAASAEVSIAGSGKVQLHAAQLLDINIAGSGTVRYKGSPVVTSSVSGSGSITKL